MHHSMPKHGIPSNVVYQGINDLRQLDHNPRRVVRVREAGGATAGRQYKLPTRCAASCCLSLALTASHTG
jgi:hypothetical protein